MHKVPVFCLIILRYINQTVSFFLFVSLLQFMHWFLNITRWECILISYGHFMSFCWTDSLKLLEGIMSNPNIDFHSGFTFISFFFPDRMMNITWILLWTKTLFLCLWSCYIGTDDLVKLDTYWQLKLLFWSKCSDVLISFSCWMTFEEKAFHVYTTNQLCTFTPMQLWSLNNCSFKFNYNNTE